MTCWWDAFVSLTEQFSPLNALQLWCKGKTWNDNHFWNAVHFKSFSLACTPSQTTNSTGSRYECKGERIECTTLVWLCPQIWARIQDDFQLMSDVVAVSLSEKKYYENTNQYFKNKHTYRLLSSASRGGLRKGLPLLCNSNKTHFFCGKTRSGIYLTTCLSYNASWYAMGVVLLTNCRADCRHHTMWLGGAKWICSFEGYTCHKQTWGLHRLAFEGFVIITNLD